MFNANAQLSGQTQKAEIDSPAGRLTALVSEIGLQALLWDAHRAQCDAELAALPEADGHPVIEVLKEQLAAYFDGALTAFDVPLDVRGTPFQQQVWAHLQTIPYGQTRTYAEVARALGNAQLTRAVGGANSKNPVSIVIPCHRVIGASGALTGYAGGKQIKAFLLALERGQGKMDLFCENFLPCVS